MAETKLIYDLFGNVLLVQRVYLCTHGRKVHRITASSPDLMKLLPQVIQAKFPVVLFKRSACTKKSLMFIVNAVYDGLNFLKISENIAGLNQEEHTRLGVIYYQA